MKQNSIFETLRRDFDGDIFTDLTHKILYATDASSYREIPAAVTFPAGREDVRKLINFALQSGLSVIPRGAGTSLAGQVVGPGIVADVSKYMTSVIELNEKEKWVVVEPGINLAELNIYLASFGLMFGPETSTANRCCLGGMLGNNSCGLHSIIYGSVRDHILEVDTILADGSDALFRELSTEEFIAKCNGEGSLLETGIYNKIRHILSHEENRKLIEEGYPDRRITRRNNGYALDILADSDPFTGNGEKINISKLLAGSEGTLAFTVSMKLNLIDIPQKKTGLVCAHFSSMQDALKANIIALRYNPASIELIDDIILSCTRDNLEQSRNRFFINGDPAVVLIIEFLEESTGAILDKALSMEASMRKEGYGYHFPLITDDAGMKKVWELRRAGLGVLLNIPGRKKSVQVIEDTSVLPEFYPDYFLDFEKILSRYDLKCSYYGHIATGELHISPLLDLKEKSDIEIYRLVARDVALLVKRYRGSLSGEHGDGRLRGEFIPLMLGDAVYSMLKEVKKAFDPSGILNPGKITDTPPITDNLRYIEGTVFSATETVFSFPERDGILHYAEKCSGSGDCRKSHLIGGTMCPTYMVTRSEENSTRGRANLLREFLTRSPKKNRFDHKELLSVMDLCISCKACKSECPSNVDMAKLKAEFLQHYYDIHGVPFRSLLVGWLPDLNRAAYRFRHIVNFLTGTSVFRKAVGFTTKRKIPEITSVRLTNWRRSNKSNKGINGKVYLFADEFTEFNESDIGIKCILLLERLGYEVIIPVHRESGRTFLSKGLLRSARKVANRNVTLLKDLVSKDSPLIGIEPSALLTFRDEYPDIVDPSLAKDADSLSGNTLLIDEFICREADKGKIGPQHFCIAEKKILLHGHCQQKAVSSTSFTKRMLSIPLNFKVEEIPSGCCGMAGSFGYEKEHYELSMKIGEMILFPEVRMAPPEVLIAAPGTSCRHHISDGTGRKPFHPVEILYEALI